MASLPIRTALDGPTKPETVPGPPCFIGGVPLRLLLWSWGNRGRVASSSAVLLTWGYSPVVAKCFPWFCQALRHHTLRKGQISLSFLHSKTQLLKALQLLREGNQRFAVGAPISGKLSSQMRKALVWLGPTL